MVRVGVLARFEAEPGSDEEMAAFFREGLSIVEAQPAGTVWFAFRVSETTYGAFAAFAAAEDREALLANGGPQLSRRYRHLFAVPPSFEKVDVLETRLVTD
jgi:quinol monooxygenase YgiN